MKITVDREKLNTAVSKLHTVVPARATLPVLQSILFKAENGKLTLYASNLEAFLYTAISARVLEPGGIAIDASTLKSILSKKLPSDNISISVKDKTATITSGAFSVDLPATPAEDYPPIPAEVNDTPLKIYNLREALDSVSYAVAKEDSRPVLNAVYINKNDKHFEVAAADGFRLAIAKLKATGDLKANTIIPFGTVRSLLKTLTDGPVLLHTETEEGKPSERATLKYDGYTLTTVCILGTYPNYRQLVPNHKHYTGFNVNDMTKALSYFSVDKTSFIRLVADEGKLNLSTKADETTYKYAISYKCHRIKIALNGIYLKELLSQLQGDAVMKFDKVSDPVYVKQGIAQHLLMPMFVKWDGELEE